ncbi:hypothetical protein [Streptomyces sp. NPDC056549]|uniref:hypothetical protein n=1 Tax=Streptomyces sp. NPDC056549 TaxID=3345864 RepID=UPI0036D01232
MQEGIWIPSPTPPPSILFSSLARGFADASFKVADELSKTFNETVDVDFTNMQFPGRYAFVLIAGISLPSCCGSLPSPSAPSVAYP